MLSLGYLRSVNAPGRSATLGRTAYISDPAAAAAARDSAVVARVDHRPRMRGSNDAVARAWARRAWSAGRSGNGNLWFEGDTIYSYGRHFPIARFTEALDGSGPVVLFTTDTYSPTTAQHKGDVRAALLWAGLGGRTFDVPFLGIGYRPEDLADMHAANLADYERRISEAHAKARKATKHRDVHIETAKRLRAERDRCAAAWKVNTTTATAAAD